MDSNTATISCDWCGRAIASEWITCGDAGDRELRQLAASPAVDPICLPHLLERGFAPAETGVLPDASASR